MFYLLYLFALLFKIQILLSLPPVSSLLRWVLSLGYSVMPSQQSELSNRRRNFVCAKFRRLNEVIFTAVGDEDHGFDFQQAQDSSKDHLAETERMTMYLFHHLPENISQESQTNAERNELTH